MGVQGLRAQLSKHSNPSPVTFTPGEACGSGLPSIGTSSNVANNGGRLILVDGTAALALVMRRIGMHNADYEQNSASQARDVYEMTVSFFKGILVTGLDVTVVLSGALEPGSEAVTMKAVSDRCRSGTGMHGPMAEIAFEQALIDLGISIERAAMENDILLLALYVREPQNVFAVVTDNTDFLIYGVEGLVFPGDIAIERNCSTFFLWSVATCWLTWRKRRQPYARNVTLMQRAQVAALLGSDSSKFARSCFEDRHREASVRSKIARVASPTLPSPVVAAELALLREDLPLDLPFFKTDLNVKQATEAEVEIFEKVVQGYMKDVKFAMRVAREKTFPSLRLNEGTLPWVCPALASRVGSEVVPRYLRSMAARGASECGGGFMYKKDHDRLQGARQEALQMLFSAGNGGGGGSAPNCYEYGPYSKKLIQMTQQQGSSPGPEVSDSWFDPSEDVSDMSVVANESDSGKGALSETFDGTAEALRAADPTAPELIVLYHALLLHAASATSGILPAELRAHLLPGLPMVDPVDIEAAQTALEEAFGKPLIEAEAPSLGAGLNTMEVDVGSSLSTTDWGDIDNKDVVAKARAHPGFRLMGVIQPWEAVREAPEMAWDRAFQYFYVQRKHNDMWKKLAKACMPDKYAEVSKDKSSFTAMPTDQVIEELRKPRGGNLRTARWLEAFQRGSPMDMLSLRRLAILAGPKSPEWAGAKTCWSQMTDDVKLSAFEMMHSSLNKEGFTGDGPPRRYKHQQQVMDMVDEQLAKIREASRARRPLPLPLHVILCTPTGSGKTFTALMMYQQLLRDKHPNVVMLYSVPTKQVLKAVGQQCEAHQLIYWTAARDGDGHQVRRPYSVRNKNLRKLKPEVWQQYKGFTSGTGTIEQQFALIEDVAKDCMDRGGGRPRVIIADIMSTAAILKASWQAEESCWYHHSKIVLYFDEPNMGVHLDQNVLKVVKNIMNCAPDTTILASATLSAWSELPAYWKGRTLPAERVTVSQEPYELPMAKLQVLNLKKGELRTVNPLQLFESQAEFASLVENSDRRRVLMLRYFSPKQANELLGYGLSTSERNSWNALYGDVRTLRESVEPAVRELAMSSPERYKQMYNKWEESPRPIKGGLLGVFSREGVTLVATLRSREMAYKLAGYGDQESWKKSVHRLKARIRDAMRMQKSSEKEADRRKDDDEGAAQDAELMDASITLRTGMSVSVSECKEADEDELVMLSKGIAYAHSGPTSPVVKRLYQQALLSHPDHTKKTGRAPPINVLVVDYSSIYGTDCPAVDTIILMPDLGKKLAWEDHQQFLGRLRRDGTAIYLSHRLLRFAVLGDAVDLGEEGIDGADLRRRVASIVAGAEEEDGAAGVTIKKDALDKIPLGEGVGRGELAGYVMATLLSRALPCPLEGVEELDIPSYGVPASSGAAPPTDANIANAFKKGMLKWRKAIAGLLTNSESEVAALRVVNAMALGMGDAFQSLQGVAERMCAGSLAARILKILFDEDYLSEESMLKWADKEDPQSLFLKAGEQFITWLKEADEESEEEESDEN